MGALKSTLETRHGTKAAEEDPVTRSQYLGDRVEIRRLTSLSSERKKNIPTIFLGEYSSPISERPATCGYSGWMRANFLWVPHEHLIAPPPPCTLSRLPPSFVSADWDVNSDQFIWKMLLERCLALLEEGPKWILPAKRDGFLRGDEMARGFQNEMEMGGEFGAHCSDPIAPFFDSAASISGSWKTPGVAILGTWLYSIGVITGKNWSFLVKEVSELWINTVMNEFYGNRNGD